MRETRLSGLEGGGADTSALPTPIGSGRPLFDRRQNVLHDLAFRPGAGVALAEHAHSHVPGVLVAAADDEPGGGRARSSARRLQKRTAQPGK